MSNEGASFLIELREFLNFLRKLWGMLAGISVFFPLSNVLVKLIPLKSYSEEGGVYEHLSPSLITAVATIVTLFVFLWTFYRRSQFTDNRKRSTIPRQAWISLIAGISALVCYVATYVMYSSYAWEVWGWESGDPRKMFAEAVLLIFYCVFFAFTTRAFMLLGMLEYFRPARHARVHKEPKE